MKPKNILLLLTGAFLGFAISATAQQTNPRPNRAIVQFEINLTVDRAQNGVQMKCIDGCIWETLSFACDPNGPDCERSFDEGGTPAD